MGGTWFDFEILFAPNSVDFQAGTQDGLGERDWLLGNDVRPFSLKHWMRFHVHFDQEVTSFTL